LQDSGHVPIAERLAERFVERVTTRGTALLPWWDWRHRGGFGYDVR